MALFSCPLCAFSSDSSLLHRSHVRCHSAASCRGCRRRFASAYGLLLHRKLRPCSRGTPQRSTPSQTQSEEGSGKETGNAGDVKNYQKSTRADQTQIVNGSSRPSFRCAKCSKSYTSKQRFLDHMLRSASCEREAGRFRCGGCSAAFAQAGRLRLHLASPGACRLRRRKTELNDLLAQASSEKDQSDCVSFDPEARPAKKSTEPRARLVCPKCDSSFGSRRHLFGHLRSRVACRRRRRRREILARLAEAIRQGGNTAGQRNEAASPSKATEKGNTCPRCGKVFSLVGLLGDHLESRTACERQLSRARAEAAMTEAGSWKCAKCNAEFPSRRRHQAHESRSKSCGSKSSRFVCSKCSFACPTAGELREHLGAPRACLARVREQELRRRLGGQVVGRATSCPQCQRTFASWDKLREHMRRSRSCGDQAERYVCDACSAPFSMTSDLARHQKTGVSCQQRLRKADVQARVERDATTGASRCLKCRALFGRRSKLLVHMRQSRSCGDTIDRFKCTKCGASFPMPSELKNHLKKRKACQLRAQRLALLRETLRRDPADNVACVRCEATFASEHLLLDHLNEKTKCSDKAKAFTCSKCSYGFSSLHELASHRRSEVACKTNVKRTALLEEVAAATGQHKCLRCGVLLVSAAELSVHMSPTGPCPSKAARVACPTCGAAVAGLMELAAHRRTGEACRLRIRRQSLTTRLPMLSEEAGKFPCTSCDARFKRKVNLLKHLRSSRSCGDRAWGACVCDDCGAGFSQPSQLANHRRTGKACRIRLRQQSLRARRPGGPVAAGEVPCPSCGAEFSKRDYLTSHMRASRSCGDRAEACVCDDCGAAFAQPYQLANHMATGKACRFRLRLKGFVSNLRVQNDAEEDHQCGLCNAVFKHLSLLERHARSGIACKSRLRRKTMEEKARYNIDDGSYSCRGCERSFSSWGSVSSHLSSNKVCGDKADGFACSTCDATFAGSHHLTRHQKSGTACQMRLQRKAFLTQAQANAPAVKQISPPPLAPCQLSCPKCSKAFKARQFLLEHLSVSRSCGDRAERYPCPTCAKAFPVPSALAKHQRSLIACRLVRKQEEVRELVKHPSQKTTKEAYLLRCPTCAYTATSAYTMSQHRSRPKACRVQSSRVQSLCASLAISSCPNCGEEQGDPKALMEHLAHGSECVRMPSFDEPVIPALESRLGIKRAKIMG